eukprot:TRINITY_DN102780_c0_g1_i1.p1 TRINITY_DN102780_c0_g1~~TRINITY_DN102780_c0_g1_i1.p1  ORF type:complete len:372 (-),score=66.05 TRINITY_DN102780_c0_g1_i1:378-1493(-)
MTQIVLWEEPRLSEGTVAYVLSYKNKKQRLISSQQRDAMEALKALLDEKQHATFEEAKTFATEQKHARKTKKTGCTGILPPPKRACSNIPVADMQRQVLCEDCGVVVSDSNKSCLPMYCRRCYAMECEERGVKTCRDCFEPLTEANTSSPRLPYCVLCFKMHVPDNSSEEAAVPIATGAGVVADEVLAASARDVAGVAAVDSALKFAAEAGPAAELRPAANLVVAGAAVTCDEPKNLSELRRFAKVLAQTHAIGFAKARAKAIEFQEQSREPGAYAGRPAQVPNCLLCNKAKHNGKWELNMKSKPTGGSCYACVASCAAGFLNCSRSPAALKYAEVDSVVVQVSRMYASMINDVCQCGCQGPQPQKYSDET